MRNYDNPWKGFGGYMPDPPEDCKKTKNFKHLNGTTYIDFSICFKCTCKRKVEYQKECKKFRQNRSREGKENEGYTEEES